MSLKPIIFSGVQPTGNLHLGNFFGALKNWKELQASENYQNFFCIVDQHAITVKQDPQKLNQKILEVAALYLACGIDPKKSIIFVQSSISEHSELAWILGTIAKLGELELMTQFKDKSSKNTENLNLGLLSYPVLMAADILLYDTDLVPVGQDQTQHLELTRELASRFNRLFGETFKLPKQYTEKIGAKIMGLDNPLQKMSKSAISPKNYLALLDLPEITTEKILTATTDSEKEIIYDKENKPGISNLLEIFALSSGKKISEIEKEYTGKSYKDFKKDLAEIVNIFLTPIRTKANYYLNEGRSELLEILKAGSNLAKNKASKKMNEVKEKIGYLSI